MRNIFRDHNLTPLFQSLGMEAGAIVGVGGTRRLSAVKWGVASRIVWAWILTIPAAGLIAALSFWFIEAIHTLAG